MTKLALILGDVPLLLRQLLYGVIRNNASKIATRLRMWSMRTPCQIDTGVYITQPRNFHAAPGSGLRHGCHIGNTHGQVTIGRKSHLGSFCHINAVYGQVNIGSDVAIGPGTKIFSYSNQYVDGQPIHDSKVTADVAIGDHVFVGANVTVLPGAEIESNVVVGAGSVVKGRLQSNGLYVGSPCRRVRELDTSRCEETEQRAE